MRPAIALILLLCFLASGAQAQGPSVTRVEPPHWWAGMHDPRLQLMIHGPRVGRLNARILHRGVRLTGIQRADNPDYLFLDIEIDAQAQPGPLHIQFVGDTRVLGGFDYLLKARRADSAQRSGPGLQDLAYLLVPDRFANAEAANDLLPGMRESTVERSDPAARHGGDLRGIHAALDYLDGLRVTLLWPAPLLESDLPAHSYRGDAPTDLYRIDPRLGSHADYLQLVAAARGRGIGVIQQLVVDQVGTEHPWVHAPPIGDWIHTTEGSDPDARRDATPSCAPAGAAAAARRSKASPPAPALNPQQPMLMNYLIQNSIWWIEEAGLSGLQLDRAEHLDAAFLHAWHQRVGAEYPQLDLPGAAARHRPAASPARPAPDSPTPGQINLEVRCALLEALGPGAASPVDWSRLHAAQARQDRQLSAAPAALFDGGHDAAPLFGALEEDLSAWKRAIAFLLTSRELPQLPYGSEILLSGSRDATGRSLHGDFPGGWPGDPRSAFSAEGLSAAQREAQAFFRHLARFRAGAAALQHGALVQFAPQNGIYLYARRSADQTVLVALSGNPDDAWLALAPLAGSLPAHRRGIDVLSGAAVTLDARLPVPGRGLRIIALAHR